MARKMTPHPKYNKWTGDCMGILTFICNRIAHPMLDRWHRGSCDCMVLMRCQWMQNSVTRWCRYTHLDIEDTSSATLIVTLNQNSSHFDTTWFGIEFKVFGHDMIWDWVQSLHNRALVGSWYFVRDQNLDMGAWVLAQWKPLLWYSPKVSFLMNH